MLRATARGGLVNLAGSAVAGGAGFAATWLAARGLGDPGRVGAYFSAVAGFTLAGGVAKLGTQTSLVYWPARLRALGARQELPRCLHHGLTPVALGALVIAAGLGIAAGFTSAAVSAPLRMLAFFLPLAALTDALLAASRGYRTMRPTVTLDRLLRPVLQALLLGGLVVAVRFGLPPGPEVFAAAWAAPYVPVAALAGYVLVRVHQRDRSGSGAAVFEVRDYWTFTAPRALASVAQLALQRVDVLLVAAWGSLPAAALYGVAGKYVVLGQLVNGGLAQSVQPRLAERLAVGDLAGARTLYQQSTAWLVLTTWPVHLLVAANAATYLGLFGPHYPAGRTVVWILAGAMLLSTACGMVDMVLSMAGRTRWNLYNVALALSTMVGLDLVLVPRFGAAGAAGGLAAAIAVNNLVPLAQIHRLLGLHPFGRATLLAAGLTLASCGVAPMVATAAGAGPVTLVAVSGFGVTALAVGAYALRRPLDLELTRGARR
jgi:O-antigen/teichoic acid export membrane protein